MKQVIGKSLRSLIDLIYEHDKQFGARVVSLSNQRAICPTRISGSMRNRLTQWAYKGTYLPASNSARNLSVSKAINYVELV